VVPIDEIPTELFRVVPTFDLKFELIMIGYDLGDLGLQILIMFGFNLHEDVLF
jgi:hypothetical protein